MAYKCLNCRVIFEDVECVEESRGEYWGETCYEPIYVCPQCGVGNFEETIKCEICGEDFCVDDLHGGVCDSCIDKRRKDFKTCFNISLGESESININRLLASLFDVDDIEAILVEYVLTRYPEADFSKFIDDDKEWFGERLVEEVRR